MVITLLQHSYNTIHYKRLHMQARWLDFSEIRWWSCGRIWRVKSCRRRSCSGGWVRNRRRRRRRIIASVGIRLSWLGRRWWNSCQSTWGATSSLCKPTDDATHHSGHQPKHATKYQAEYWPDNSGHDGERRVCMAEHAFTSVPDHNYLCMCPSPCALTPGNQLQSRLATNGVRTSTWERDIFEVQCGAIARYTESLTHARYQCQ